VLLKSIDFPLFLLEHIKHQAMGNRRSCQITTI